MRIVITIEDGPSSVSAAPAADTGTPGPVLIDSMPASPDRPPADVAARARAAIGISGGPAPEIALSADGAPPAFIPDPTGAVGASTAGDVPAGPAPGFVDSAGGGGRSGG